MASSIGASTKVSTGSVEESVAASHGGKKVHQPPLSKPWGEWKSVKPPSKDLPLSPPKAGKKDAMPEMNLKKGVLGLSSPSSNRANEAKSKSKVDSREQQPKIRALGTEASKAEENDNKEEQNSSAIGLKLGKRTYLEDVEAGNKPPPTTPAQAAAAATSSPWKKGRGSPQGNVTPKCQVEGCKADLAGSKDYHRRHKVCEVHSKTPKNTVNGQEQRFCQQCSRFHLLAEFDEGKRSCRRRLAGHNERRRKPQPDALAAYSMGNGSSLQASYQRLGSSIIVDGHGDAIAYGGGSWHQQFLGKQLPENLSAEKLLMLLQNSKRPTTTTTINATSMAKKAQIGLTLSSSSPGGADSSRALSLLSSEPWSPTTNESPSSVSYEHHHLSAAVNNNNNSTQYLMMGGDVSSAAVDNKKFQQHQSMQQAAQAQDAIPISSSSSGSSNKGHQPYASPIRMGKSFENHSSMLALMHGQALQVANSQARPAIDLMQAPSSQQQKRSSPGTTQYMHSMKPFEAQVFESQQML